MIKCVKIVGTFQNLFNKKITPRIVIAYIDQTDIGDELCRYRNLRKKENGRVIVRPEDENSVEYNSAYFIIDNFNMFLSDNFSIIKIIHYFKNYLKQKNNFKKNKIRCGRDKILSPLKNGLFNMCSCNLGKLLVNFCIHDFAAPCPGNTIIDAVSRSLLVVATHSLYFLLETF